MHLKYITYLVTENSSKLVIFSEAKNSVSVHLFFFQSLLTNNFVKILNLNTTPLFVKHTLRFLMRRDTSPVQYCYYFYSTISFSVGNKRFDAIHLKQRKRSTQNQISTVCSYYLPHQGGSHLKCPVCSGTPSFWIR